jgi:hypothetical protein
MRTAHDERRAHRRPGRASAHSSVGPKALEGSIWGHELKGMMVGSCSRMAAGVLCKATVTLSSERRSAEDTTGVF